LSSRPRSATIPPAPLPGRGPYRPAETGRMGAAVRNSRRTLDDASQAPFVDQRPPNFLPPLLDPGPLPPAERPFLIASPAYLPGEVARGAAARRAELWPTKYSLSTARSGTHLWIFQALRDRARIWWYNGPSLMVMALPVAAPAFVVRSGSTRGRSRGGRALFFSTLRRGNPGRLAAAAPQSVLAPGVIEERKGSGGQTVRRGKVGGFTSGGGGLPDPRTGRPSPFIRDDRGRRFLLPWVSETGSMNTGGPAAGAPPPPPECDRGHVRERGHTAQRDPAGPETFSRSGPAARIPFQRGTTTSDLPPLWALRTSFSLA